LYGLKTGLSEQETVSKTTQLTLFRKVFTFPSEFHNFAAVGTNTYRWDFVVKHQNIEKRQRAGNTTTVTSLCTVCHAEDTCKIFTSDELS
jgi:hypothetical protein